MLKFTNLAVRRGGRQLFSGVTLTIERGYKVGITGVNGCGKSSLLALLRQEFVADEGHIAMPPNLSMAYVAQELPATSKTALEYVLDGDAELRSIQQELQRAHERGDGHALGKWYDRLEAIDAYTAESRAIKIMQGLGFQIPDIRKPAGQFSGGWRMRLNLAQALICRSDLLLLDEPTNHLDLDAIFWLEAWLLQYTGTLLLISHDRDFLDHVTDHIVHIDQQTAKLYRGNYSSFEKQRAEHLAQQQAFYEKQQQQVAHMTKFIERFRAKATKAKQAQSRIKALQRMELVARAHVDSPFYFHFAKPEKLPTHLLQLEEAAAGYDGHMIFEKVDLAILAGDRIGLLGRNGAGKSTFIKLLAGELPPVQGKVECARHVKIGYFAQHQLEQLDPHASALLHLQRLDPKVNEQDARNYLGSFNFMSDRVLEPVALFSGGEKARLVLALLIYQKPALLLLDEPTNHLDMDMRLALSLALQDYEGAVVIISHDRYMLQSVADRFLLVDSGRVTPFDGNLEDYHGWLTQRSGRHQEKSENTDAALSKKQLRQQQAEKRRLQQPLKKELQTVEKRLAELQAQKKMFENEMATPELYEAEQKDRLLQICAAQAALQQEIAALEEQWLHCSEQLEALSNEAMDELP